MFFKNSTLSTLQKSLLNLTSYNALHYETVADQIEKTRYAIMAFEGKPINEAEQAEFLALNMEKKLLAKEVERLQNRLQYLREEIKKLQESDDEKNIVEKSVLFQK